MRERVGGLAWPNLLPVTTCRFVGLFSRAFGFLASVNANNLSVKTETSLI